MAAAPGASVAAPTATTQPLVNAPINPSDAQRMSDALSTIIGVLPPLPHSTQALKDLTAAVSAGLEKLGEKQDTLAAVVAELAVGLAVHAPHTSNGIISGSQSHSDVISSAPGFSDGGVHMDPASSTLESSADGSPALGLADSSDADLELPGASTSGKRPSGYTSSSRSRPKRRPRRRPSLLRRPTRSSR